MKLWGDDDELREVDYYSGERECKGGGGEKVPVL